jgi:hypothetical protein
VPWLLSGNGDERGFRRVTNMGFFGPSNNLDGPIYVTRFSSDTSAL